MAFPNIGGTRRSPSGTLTSRNAKKKRGDDRGERRRDLWKRDRGKRGGGGEKDGVGRGEKGE